MAMSQGIQKAIEMQKKFQIRTWSNHVNISSKVYTTTYSIRIRRIRFIT